ncbi:hypothetical protein ACFY7C_36010 [Streptomyces sp. NPDC012769]|uniref:hypothetical protein n=1 Tax=Streptomyces sp. NPDC012769 TaxID=3364848 RepID=UPI00369B73E8
MCVSTAPAEFTGTTLYAGRLTHAEHGLIHVLGYQNTAVNRADGPNAMLLHLPAVRITPDHFVSVGQEHDLLERMVEAVRPAAASDDEDPIAWMGWTEPPAVHVFEHDVYTVVLAEDPALVPAALARVPWRKRPVLSDELFAFYAEKYPGHAIAVCCFDNAQAAQAKPLLLWYEPHDPDELRLPALDCHTGGAPDLDAEVATDHWVVFGTDEAPEGWGEPVRYPAKMRHALRAFLPERVVGDHYGEPLPNGDFVLRHEDLLAEALDRVRRQGPGARGSLVG